MHFDDRDGIYVITDTFLVTKIERMQILSTEFDLHYFNEHRPPGSNIVIDLDLDPYGRTLESCLGFMTSPINHSKDVRHRGAMKAVKALASYCWISFPKTLFIRVKRFTESRGINSQRIRFPMTLNLNSFAFKRGRPQSAGAFYYCEVHKVHASFLHNHSTAHLIKCVVLILVL